MQRARCDVTQQCRVAITWHVFTVMRFLSRAHKSEQNSEAEVSRKLEERIETRNTQEYRRSTSEKFACEIEYLMCAVVQR
jgi:hypothetical protein